MRLFWLVNIALILCCSNPPPKNDMKAEKWIEDLEMIAHPEGGYYKETYKSSGTIPQASLPGYPGDRAYSTGIYFLLNKNDFSAFHILRQDEMWHFYDGTTLHVHVIHPDGEYELIKLGNRFDNGEVLQAVVPGGSYFGSEVADKSSYALVGCTVSPGFDFEDFEMPDAAKLTNLFPDHSEVIQRITRN